MSRLWADRGEGEEASSQEKSAWCLTLLTHEGQVREQ